MSRHSFDPQIAAQVGLNAAVIFQNLFFWIEKNEANGHNFKDGRYWTYNSIAAFAKLFPYFTEKQIRTGIDKLLDAGLILKGNYSDDRYDRTAWYALNQPICPSGQIDPPDGKDDAFAQKGKRSAPEGKSLENRYNPDGNPPPARAGAREAAEVELEVIWAAYPADRRRDRTSCRRYLVDALGEVSSDELLAAVRAYAAESASFTRAKVSFLDNCLRDRKWRRHVDDLRQRAGEAEAAAERQLAQIAVWVKARHGMCKHVSESPGSGGRGARADLAAGGAGRWPSALMRRLQEDRCLSS